MWFPIVIALILLSSVIVILVRIDGRKEAERLKGGDLTADDFEIIE